MRKLLKIGLVALGSLAVIAASTSLSMGATSLFYKWMDAKNNQVLPPKDSSSSRGSSISGGASSSSSVIPEGEPGINLSKDKIFLSNADHQGAASERITATVVGCSSTLTWRVISSNHITLEESVTNSGEENTVSTTDIFPDVERFMVSLTDDDSIYEIIPVYYLNEPDSLVLDTVGIRLPGGGTNSVGLTGYNNPHTYNENGLYFDCNPYMSDNRSGHFYDTYEEANEVGKGLNVTYSPGAKAYFVFRLRPYYKAYDVQWNEPYQDFEFTNDWEWFDEELSTLEYESISVRAPVYTTLFWNYEFDIELRDDFVNKIGDVVLNFGGKYFVIHFNGFIPGVTDA